MVRIAINGDSRVLAEMAVQMWDSHTVDELEAEFVETLNDKQSAFFIKYINDLPVGFAQCGLRTDYVEGTESSPVGYLEGIFVKEEYRKNGYAKELLSACEIWAKEIGCSEFASDCEIDNMDSFKFHMAMGFDEANRIICFKKRLYTVLQIPVCRADKIPLGTKGRTSILSIESSASCGASFAVSRRKLLDRECFVTSFRQGSYTPLRR